VQGVACSTAGICGTINASGTYTAPSAAPTPDAIQVVAISSDDTSQSGHRERDDLRARPF